MIIILNNYRNTHDLHKVSQIINRYAPPSENPRHYLRFIMLGVCNGTDCRIDSDDKLVKLVQQIIRFETGYKISEEDIYKVLDRINSGAY